MNSKIVVVDCGSSKMDDLMRCLEELNADTVKIHWSEISPEIYDAKGVIIGGNPALFEDVDYLSTYKEQFAFVKDCEFPVFGICFGHQVIGVEYGAKVSRGTESRGAETIEIVNSSSLFNDIKGEVVMGQDHCEEINLPKDFKLLASSASCKVEAMQHKFKPIFGVQFHPEVSGTPGLMMLKNFVKTCN